MPGNNTDSASDPVYYAISGIWANGVEYPHRFVLDQQDQRTVQVTEALDFETIKTYNVTILATSNDRGAPAGSLRLVVNVTNINEAISIISSADAYLTENLPSGTTFYQVLTADVDGPTDPAYFLSVPPLDGGFVLDFTSGNLTSTRTFNYEQENPSGRPYGIKATDRLPGTIDATFAFMNLTVHIVNANDAPVLLCGEGGSVIVPSLECDVFIPEDSAVGSIPYHLVVFDEDNDPYVVTRLQSSSPFNFSLLAPAGSGNTSNITVLPGPGFNYEQACCRRCKFAPVLGWSVFNYTAQSWTSIDDPAVAGCCPGIVPQCNPSWPIQTLKVYETVLFNVTDRSPLFPWLWTVSYLTFVITSELLSPA